MRVKAQTAHLEEATADSMRSADMLVLDDARCWRHPSVMIAAQKIVAAGLCARRQCVHAFFLETACPQAVLFFLALFRVCRARRRAGRRAGAARRRPPHLWSR